MKTVLQLVAKHRIFVSTWSFSQNLGQNRHHSVLQNNFFLPWCRSFWEVLNIVGMHTPKQSTTAEEKKSYWYVWMMAFVWTPEVVQTTQSLIGSFVVSSIPRAVWLYERSLYSFLHRSSGVVFPLLAHTAGRLTKIVFDLISSHVKIQRTARILLHT